jgi:hypothetical protein
MKKHSSVFLRLLFVSAAFICLVALDTGLYIHTSYRYRPSPTHIEIVLSVMPPDCAARRIPNALRARTTDSRPAAYGVPTAAFILQYYDGLILHRLSLFEPGVSPVLRIVSILQKQSVWHRFSDEDPLPSC